MYYETCSSDLMLSLQGVAGSDGLPGENGEPVSVYLHWYEQLFIYKQLLNLLNLMVYFSAM